MTKFLCILSHNYRFHVALLSSRYRLARYIFTCVLALIYLVAFAYLGVQITGLIGENSILPVADYLQAVRGARFDRERWFVGFMKRLLEGK